MAARKSVKKSGLKSGAAKRPGTFSTGVDPRRGRGPAKGAPNAGRPHEEFREMCRGLASREETLARVMAILQDSDHAQFMPALKWATENGYGKAKETVEHTGEVQHAHRMLKWGDMEIPL